MTPEQLEAPGLEYSKPTWFPAILHLPNGGHLHMAIWWTWKGAWKDENLPRGVELLTILTARRGCGLCDEWKSVLGWPEGVEKPENAGPGGVEGRPGALSAPFRPAGGDPDPESDVGRGPEDVETTKTNPFNDF